MTCPWRSTVVVPREAPHAFRVEGAHRHASQRVYPTGHERFYAQWPNRPESVGCRLSASLITIGVTLRLSRTPPAAWHATPTGAPKCARPTYRPLLTYGSEEIL